MRRHIKQTLAAAVQRPKSDRAVKKNSWQPQIAPPFKVDLPFARKTMEQIAVPASINGRSMIDGRL